MENKKNNTENEQLEAIKELGSVETIGGRHKIFCLTIIGEIEGHNVLPEQTKTTKYEHIIPQTDCTCAKIFGTRTASISYRLAEDDVIEIRCELKICGAVFSENRVNTVKNVNVFEDKPIPPENCALTLYFADKGEKLWDIAKSHNTKLDLLLSENSAENQVLDAPKMLLIPRI